MTGEPVLRRCDPAPKTAESPAPLPSLQKTGYERANRNLALASR